MSDKNTSLATIDEPKESKPQDNVLKLDNPFQVSDKNGTRTLTEMSYDFDALTATDIMEADKRASGFGEAKVAEMNITFHFELFAAAFVKANPTFDPRDAALMRGKDVPRATRLGRAFFAALADGEDET